MRIAFYGNTCNNFYAIARAVRRTTDIDAHLFIDSDADWMQLPESEDPTLLEDYPKWIHKGTYHSTAARFFPRWSRLVQELNAFDVAMVSGGGVRFAPFVNCEVIFYVTGWDLALAPFPLRYFSLLPRGVARKGAALLGGFWQRRGIRAATEIWSQPFAPFQRAADRLALDPTRLVSKYFPIMIDTDRFRTDPDARSSNDPNVRRIVDGHDFVVFHPSRMLFDRTNELRGRRQRQFVEACNFKGNERLIEGFARFVAENPDARPALVLIDHAFSPDRVDAKRLVQRLGIERYVVWLEGPNERGFDRLDLLPFYSVADVVADEFAIGWFGSVVVEGLSMGKPVVSFVDEQIMKQLYPWHPILSPKTPDEISACLTALYRDPDARRRIGERGRDWAVEFHSIDRAAAHYVRQIEEVAGDRSRAAGAKSSARPDATPPRVV